MHALLADLRANTRRTRLRWLLAAAMVAMLGATSYIGFTQAEQEQAVCTGAEKKLADVWDSQRKASVRAAFLASRRPYALDTFDRVATELERYTQSWAAMHTDACEATQVRGEQSVQLLDLRIACLQRMRT